ncbi:glycosyltransferase family 2 protein [Thalassotalea euphylliae]|uniref:Glycosyltransferase n=1 Tax=Thalassotalea euphylliae TaxID=1655234 RepID=A0A3E0U0F8_9GAMM|nr:glycosyltransferase family 2 protein [Thalassotalea euphylliae]REL30180.1 glycosyltransferase [Thalassotalea euphylliae]
MVHKPKQRSSSPLITVVVPSYNQGKFLEQCLESIFKINLPIEVFVLDGGSSDNSLDVIKNYNDKITWWRSHKDDGQSAAINEGIARGNAPYVCWLNSDDFFYEGGLEAMYAQLVNHQEKAFAYGKCWLTSESGCRLSHYLTLPFSAYLLANYCFICQPGTLISRKAWESIGGLNESLNLAMDYDLWWRLYNQFGAPQFCRMDIAASRAHADTKTANSIDDHYSESTDVVRNHYGRVPIKWLIAKPIMKIVRAIEHKIYKNKALQ